MALQEDIKNKVQSILDDKFIVTNVSYVPKIDNSKLTFGNIGLKFEATTVFIDMRGSTESLNKHNKSTVAKIHKAYFHTIVKIANLFNGHVRSFNGDSALIFFQGTTKSSLSTAIQAAMTMKYMLSDEKFGINKLLKKYSTVDFGIGIDDGNILCTKVGIGGDQNRDLFWIGNAVNKATVIGDSRQSPNHVGISSYVYYNLLDYVKYGMRKDYWGNETKENMWNQSTFKYDGNTENFYYTNWFFDDI